MIGTLKFYNLLAEVNQMKIRRFQIKMNSNGYNTDEDAGDENINDHNEYKSK